MKKLLLGLAMAITFLLLPVKGDAVAQPACKSWFYCSTVGQAINDPGCWCYWDSWRGVGPAPYWYWQNRDRRPGWDRWRPDRRDWDRGKHHGRDDRGRGR